MIYCCLNQFELPQFQLPATSSLNPSFTLIFSPSVRIPSPAPKLLLNPTFNPFRRPFFIHSNVERSLFSRRS